MGVFKLLVKFNTGLCVGAFTYYKGVAIFLLFVRIDYQYREHAHGYNLFSKLFGKLPFEKEASNDL